MGEVQTASLRLADLARQAGSREMVLDGEIAVVGSRGGKGEGDTSLANARSLTCRIRRILVGSRLQFEQMNRAVEVNGIKPVIDGKLFKFEEAESALRYLSEGRAFGKVVVEI